MNFSHYGGRMNIRTLKMRCWLWLALFLSVAILARASSADDAFEKLARASIEELLVTHPETATTLGDHRFDDRLSDYSREARQAEETSLRGHLATLQQIDAAGLTGANRVDAQILRLNLEAALFELT
jgi:uncharacterized protein (DUF885 family)